MVMTFIAEGGLRAHVNPDVGTVEICDAWGAQGPFRVSFGSNENRYEMACVRAARRVGHKTLPIDWIEE